MHLDYLLNDTPLNCSTHQNTEDLFNGAGDLFLKFEGGEMADALAEKIVASLTWTAPNETGAQALRDFFDFHKQYMIEKCHKEGPLKLIQYVIAEAPEYKEDGSIWIQGKFPEKTGRIVFHHYEIYETSDGLHHHWIDGAQFLPELLEMLDTYSIELRMNNQVKVIHSLWD